jgi:EAL domain-containing protein (putative c-di-GMP-specific phosphodiesterase class I)
MNSAKPLGLCTRCERLPNKIEGTGKLYLWFSLGHSLMKVIHYLRKAGLDYELKEDGQCVVISLEENQIQGCVNTLAGILTNNELKDTQTLFTTRPGEPQLRDFPKTMALSRFKSLSQSDWLLDMLAAERVTSQFQPIVYANDTSRVFGQEALLRGVAPDGSLISPGQIFPLAAEAGILVQLDLLARRSAIREAMRHRIKERIFINFSPTSIYDPAFCLRSTMKAIDEAGISHDQVIFEVVESDHIQDVAHLKGILNVYREAGFLMALDDFGAGYSNLNLLHELRPDLLKLDMSLIRNVYADPYKALVTEKILEIANRLNIRTVAEGIECTEELDWVRERGATFAQGYLIAKPTTLPMTKPPRIAAENLVMG